MAFFSNLLLPATPHAGRAARGAVLAAALGAATLALAACGPDAGGAAPTAAGASQSAPSQAPPATTPPPPVTPSQPHALPTQSPSSQQDKTKGSSPQPQDAGKDSEYCAALRGIWAADAESAPIPDRIVLTERVLKAAPADHKPIWEVGLRFLKLQEKSGGDFNALSAEDKAEAAKLQSDLTNASKKMTAELQAECGPIGANGS